MTHPAAPYLGAIGEPLLVLGPDGTVRLANAALRRLVERDDLEGGRLDEARLVTPEVAREVLGRHARAETGQLDTTVRASEGRVRAVRLVQAPAADGDSVLLFMDLEPAARLARQEKLAAMGTLVAGVAHEVRTPLAYMATNLHLVRHRLEEAAEKGEAAAAPLPDVVPLLHEVMQGIDRINRLVVELRRFTRPVALQRKVTTLNRAIEPALAVFEATSRGRVQLVAHLEGALPVNADEAQIQQVVLNLLDNAADAAPGGSVSVHTRDTAEGPELEVADHGRGIPPEQVPHVFDALYTTKAQGTGLGLAIVARIARDHGARVHVESAVGKGTRVRVTFPLVQ